jgi:hypothetical protein
MIRTCQGKTEISLHLTGERLRKRDSGFGLRHDLLFEYPLRIGPTRQRDQTSICGNSLQLSTKIECE